VECFLREIDDADQGKISDGSVCDLGGFLENLLCLVSMCNDLLAHGDNELPAKSGLHIRVLLGPGNIFEPSYLCVRE